jgi:ParB family chromosome partitioning protein
MSKSAIDASRVNAFKLNPESLHLITNPEHPLYDQRVRLPVKEGLVQSIMANGFCTVITVQKNGDQIVVVDGMQRVKAAVEANRRLKEKGCEPVEVIATLKKGLDAQIFGVKLASNGNRQDDPPTELAEKLARYLALGRSVEEAAACIGVEVAEAKRLLQLLDLSPKVLAKVDRGQISVCAAAKLSKLSREEQEKQLAEVPEDRKVTVQEASRRVKKAKGQKVSEAPGKKLIKKVAASSTLHPEAAAALLWVLGGQAGGSIAGAVKALASEA